MRNLILFFAVASYLSCGIKSEGISGRYGKPVVITSDNSFEQVWSNVIDFFATEGISIKVIDKSSGLIVTEKYNLRGAYTQEGKNGELMNPSAFVVISKCGKLGPDWLTGEWNVRIKSLPDGKTSINVNLLNIQGHVYRAESTYTFKVDCDFTGQSTGVFEKGIAEKLK
jgi:hypothetical protein